MGLHVSIVAVAGCDAAGVAQRLGVRLDDAEIAFEDAISRHNSDGPAVGNHNGFALVVDAHGAVAFRDPQMRDLTRDGEAFVVFIEEHTMCSWLTRWVDGRAVWEVGLDPDEGIVRTGSPPEELLRSLLGEAERNPALDFDVAPRLFQTLTGIDPTLVPVVLRPLIMADRPPEPQPDPVAVLAAWREAERAVFAERGFVEVAADTYRIVLDPGPGLYGVVREPKTVKDSGFAGFAEKSDRVAGVHAAPVERELSRYAGVDYEPLRLTVGACLNQFSEHFWEERFHGSRQDFAGIPTTAAWTGQYLDKYILPELHRFTDLRSIARTPPEKRNATLRWKMSPRPMRVWDGLDHALGDGLAQPRLLLANLAAGSGTGVDVSAQLDRLRRLAVEPDPVTIAHRFARGFLAANPRPG
jgi:hypothetical protein